MAQPAPVRYAFPVRKAVLSADERRDRQALNAIEQKMEALDKRSSAYRLLKMKHDTLARRVAFLTDDEKAALTDEEKEKGNDGNK